MAEKISFQFLTLKAEAEGIKSVRIIAILIVAAMLTTLALSAIWSLG